MVVFHDSGVIRVHNWHNRIAARMRPPFPPRGRRRILGVPGPIEEEKPRLVLLDLVLPGIDGIDLMKDIADTTHVPVLFLSAYGQDPACRPGLRHGGCRLRRSSPSPRRRLRSGSGRPYAGGMRPSRYSPTCWATLPPTTTSAGSPLQAVRWN